MRLTKKDREELRQILAELEKAQAEIQRTDLARAIARLAAYLVRR